MGVWNNIKNAVAAILPKKIISAPNRTAPVIRISKFQHQERSRIDVKSWRESVKEAERPFNPFRVKMVQMYLDTMLNGHVKACIHRRYSLTLSRKFKICDINGKEVTEVTKLFEKTWFRLFQRYAIDALLHGYNLIALGDVINDAFPKLRFVKRQNISPDRFNVSNMTYIVSGEDFLEPPLRDWHIYIPTPDETGASPCGYGELYEVAIYEIMLRNNLGQNADYNEVFGQPIRVGFTSKADEERDIFEQALQSMASNAYMVLDDGTDRLELKEPAGRGSAYQTFANMEERCEKKISKLLLGHADALDSVPGKLGAGTGEDNPVESALNARQSEDAAFIEPIVNEELIPRMRNMGFNIPQGLHFTYTNDEEDEQLRQREDESNKKTADIMKVIKDAGGDLTDETWEWFEERTGIPGIKKAEPPPPPEPFGVTGNGVPLPGKNGNGKPKPPFEKKPKEGATAGEDDEVEDAA